ncbi:MAG: methionine ABC transporter ATP-binding protein [Tahibacter sp.]
MIEFNQVHKSYRIGARAVAALHPFDLRIAHGEVFGIIGASGAGKSTLLRLINRLESADGGRITLDGADVNALDASGLRTLRRRVGMIFQHFNLLAAKTVAANVAFPLKLAGDMTATEVASRVEQLLARVGLSEHAHKFPAQLSGGQKQRVGVARALACKPKVLLCDEATSALDPQTTRSVLQLLAELRREFDLTIVLITHEMDVIRRVCDRVAVLDEGRIVETGSVTDVFLHPRHEVTKRFVDESEQVDSAEQRRDFIAASGRVFRLTFRGESTYAPLLGAVARETGVDYSILHGRIDRIGRTPFGQLTLALREGNIEAALQRFRDAQVSVEELH